MATQLLLSTAFLDDLINDHFRLAKSSQRYTKYTMAMLGALCADAGHVLSAEPSLLRLNAPMQVLGDLHGQLEDLCFWINRLKPPPQHKYLLLGDYVDRGQRSLETIVLLLAMKLRWPNNIFMLRGNHEVEEINREYGFRSEMVQRGFLPSYEQFQQVFDRLPLAAVVGEPPNRVLCMHGGLSRHLRSLEDIAAIQRPLRTLPDDALVTDLLWADPGSHSGFKASERRISFTFGADVLAQSCRDLGVRLVIRAHECMRTGYQHFGVHNQLLTIFSAARYAHNDNCSSVAVIEADGHTFVCVRYIGSDLVTNDP